MSDYLNVLIVDDELRARENLKALIRDYCPQLNIVATAASAEEARVCLPMHPIELIFLDISMPGETGFDLLESIESDKYYFVFVTAYDQFVLKALRASAVDYLLKPIDIDELKTAAEKVVRLRAQQNKSLNLPGGKEILRRNSSSLRGVQRLCLPASNGYTVVDTEDIIYLEADSNYTIFHLSNLKKIVAAKSLKEFEDLLDPSQFFRTHKSNILHFKYLKELSKTEGHFATMKDGSVIPISRRRWQEFQQALDAYNGVRS